MQRAAWAIAAAPFVFLPGKENSEVAGTCTVHITKTPTQQEWGTGSVCPCWCCQLIPLLQYLRLGGDTVRGGGQRSAEPDETCNKFLGTSWNNMLQSNLVATKTNVSLMLNLTLTPGNPRVSLLNYTALDRWRVCKQAFKTIPLNMTRWVEVKISMCAAWHK